MGMGCFSRLDNLCFGSLVPSIGNIIPYGSIKQPGILQDHTKHGTQISPFYIPDIYPIYGDSPFLNLIEAHDQVNQGSFSGPGRTYNGNSLTGFYVDTQVFNKGNILFIPELNVSGVIFPVLNLVNNVGYVLVCIAGGVLVAQRVIQIGDIQAFIQYIRQFTQPIMQLGNIANIIQSTVASAERVFEILDESEEVADSEDAKVIPFPQGEVKFEHVKFRYKEDVPLIEDLSINVKAGQTIAIVGPTGAGKTTLVNLIMRFYEVQEGRITIDGVDIRDIKRGDLRTMFGMVLQDTWLFNGTIRDNIAYGRDEASEAEIIQAAKAAHAHHFIMTLPEGYDTVLNEEASNISQGQKQLLTIARAFLADPTILILDEATSNVDTRTEVLIQEAMGTLMKGRTSFVIAHRLSTIREADLILVMNQGAIIEQGHL
jgi:ATP-binding cassette subfamily B multidrug efflux pump